MEIGVEQSSVQVQAKAKIGDATAVQGGASYAHTTDGKETVVSKTTKELPDSFETTTITEQFQGKDATTAYLGVTSNLSDYTQVQANGNYEKRGDTEAYGGSM